MLIGVQSGGVVERLGIDAGFAAIKAAGFEALDFNLETTWRQLKAPGPIEFYSEEEKVAAFTEEIKAAAKKHGLVFGQFHAPFPTWIKGYEGTGEKAYVAVTKAIEICAACGCDKIIVHPVLDFYPENPLTREEEWKFNIEFYSALIPHLKKYGVTCCLENMWIMDNATRKIYGSVCSDMNDAVKYIDTLNEIAGEKLFGFCLDTGHYVIIGGDLCEAIHTLGDRLVAFHIHDNDGYDDDHNAPYIGGVTLWDRFLLALRETDYKGNLSFETFGALKRFPDELIPSALKLIADTGAYFRRTLQG